MISAGRSHGPYRIDPGWNNAPPGYYPTDAEVQKQLDAGARDCMKLLKQELDNGALGKEQARSLWSMLEKPLTKHTSDMSLPADLHAFLESLPLLDDPKVLA